MKRFAILFMLFVAVVPVLVMAQPTITFIPSDGITLTRADVNKTLEENGLTKADAFHAVSDAVIIGMNTFNSCSGLISITFPLATEMQPYVFYGCDDLVSVSFGTGFKTETVIKFDTEVFGSPYDNPPILTPNIDLILGEYVLPKPDTISKIWQEAEKHLPIHPEYDYVWKSITIQKVGIKEILKNNFINIYPNPTTDYAVISFELENYSNVKIIMCDFLGKEMLEIYNNFTNVGLFTKTINAEYLSKGIYFLKIFIDGDYIIEKIIIN